MGMAAVGRSSMSRIGRGLQGFAAMVHRRTSVSHHHQQQQQQQQQQQHVADDGGGVVDGGGSEGGDSTDSGGDSKHQRKQQQQQLLQQRQPQSPPPPPSSSSSSPSASSALPRGRGRRSTGDARALANARANERYVEDLKRSVARLQMENAKNEERILDLYKQNVAKDAVIQYCTVPDTPERVELFKERSVRLDALQDELKAAMVEIDTLQKKKTKYKDAFQELQNKRSDHVCEIVELQAQLQDAGREIARLKAENQRLKQQQQLARAREAAESAAADATAELARSREENQLLFAQVQALAQSLQEKDSEKQQLAEELHDLFKDHIKVLSQQSGIAASETKKIQHISESNGFGECDNYIEGDYDQLGFQVKTLARMYTNSAEEQAREREREAQWSALLERCGTRVMFDAFRDVKELARAGLPHSRRAQVWRLMIHYHTRRDKHRSYNPSDYEASITMFTKQIDLDLMRTFPHHRDFSRADSDAVQKLRRVLVTFAHRYPDVGYCQGLNMIAGLLLLIVDEETAFWGLVAAVHHLQPKDYYTSSMLGVQVDQRVLRDLLRVRFKRIASHLERLNTDFSLAAFNFMLTIGIDAVPISTALRILDCFFCEGNKVLFRCALAMFAMHEKEILQYTDRMQLFEFFRTMGKRLYDVETLFEFAFKVLNSGIQGFSKQLIYKLRADHESDIRGEMDVLAKRRAEIEREHEDKQMKRKQQQEQEQQEQDEQQRKPACGADGTGANSDNEDDDDGGDDSDDELSTSNGRRRTRRKRSSSTGSQRPRTSIQRQQPRPQQQERGERRQSGFGRSHVLHTDSDDSDAVVVDPSTPREFDSVSFAALRQQAGTDTSDDEGDDGADGGVGEGGGQSGAGDRKQTAACVVDDGVQKLHLSRSGDNAASADVDV
ncbi:hypothetical protein PTSG_09213 [Salpingoeca rosetta]|uniref:Rab-GAP TBC domain-containing protein n=1 Tax=Salpingoeca rosetta (strain ATCC 50818 / BSB-021) TaxID=946362 RepID=F2UN16_SALR5|nr:uncharacterized protein PTSG_09213 [Salpingoeca rosetta]EGD78515.1 hypothetical protein PTSG_09213 [Salpingoeca rosetta]|eukprot:XP_004989464.1 hypothetical protein PTSG_09213 [Salpingoeca rosetta]